MSTIWTSTRTLCPEEPPWSSDPANPCYHTPAEIEIFRVVFDTERNELKLVRQTIREYNTHSLDLIKQFHSHLAFLPPGAVFVVSLLTICVISHSVVNEDDSRSGIKVIDLINSVLVS